MLKRLTLGLPSAWDSACCGLACSTSFSLCLLLIWEELLMVYYLRPAVSIVNMMAHPVTKPSDCRSGFRTIVNADRLNKFLFDRQIFIFLLWYQSILQSYKIPVFLPRKTEKNFNLFIQQTGDKGLVPVTSLLMTYCHTSVNLGPKYMVSKTANKYQMGMQ